MWYECQGSYWIDQLFPFPPIEKDTLNSSQCSVKQNLTHLACPFVRLLRCAFGYTAMLCALSCVLQADKITSQFYAIFCLTEH